MAHLEPAPPGLSDRVDLLWAAGGVSGTTSEAVSGTAPASLQELFPDAGVHLLFRRSPAGCRAVLLGPAAERATVERAPGAEYLGVRFRAGQAPRLAAVASAALTDAHVDLDAVAGVPVPEVERRLAALPDVRHRCRALAALACEAPGWLVADPVVRRGARLLEEAEGQLKVTELARALRLAPRSVERRFRLAFGMTPKRFARLVRLRYVLGALRAGDRETLAALAAELGYADQAHLVRDFKGLTGRPPGAPDAARNRRVERPETRVVHRVRRDPAEVAGRRR